LEPAANIASPVRLERRPETPAGLQVLLRLFAVPVFGFLCFFVFLAFGVPWDRVPLLGLGVATGTLIVMIVAVDRTRPIERRNLFLSLFSFSYFVFFVLPVFVFYLGDAAYHPDNSPNPIPLTPHSVTRGLLAASLGYVTLLLGFALPIGGAAANFLPRMKREWSVGSAIAVALVTIPMGWAVVLGTQFGLIPERAGSGVLGTIAQGATFGIALIALAYFRYRSNIALALLAFVIPPTMFFNFFTASKGAFIRPLVMIAVVHMLVTRRLRLSFIAAFIVLSALIYPVSMSYRIYMLSNGLSAVDVIRSPRAAFSLIAGVARTAKPGEYMREGLEATGKRLDGLGITSVVVRDAGKRVPFQNGWSIGYIPLSFVPRLLWPGKPKFETGLWITDHFGFPGIDSSTGATWIGELFFNFGWTGVLLGMGILGVWFRFLQDSFLRMDSTIPAMLAGVVITLTISSNIGGDVITPTAGVIFNLAPIVIVHWLVSQFLPPPRRLPPPL
jgi:hypothetical protein